MLRWENNPHAAITLIAGAARHAAWKSLRSGEMNVTYHNSAYTPPSGLEVALIGDTRLCSDVREARGRKTITRAFAFVRCLSAVVGGGSLCGYRRVANVGHPAAIGGVPHDLQSFVFR